MTYLVPLSQFVLTLVSAPLTVGIVRRTKACYQNRRGAPILQPYIALATLLRKEMTIPAHSSWVFRFVPYAVLASTLSLAIAIPTFVLGGWSPVVSNLFLVAALAALGSVFLVFGGMDTGSTFGNMGANREMTLAALAEPAFLTVLGTLALFSGAGNLDAVFAFFARAPGSSTILFLVPTLLALLLVILAENARYPVDNPATHLELTMVHEAMLLEYSGPYLALIEYAAALRLTVFGALFMNVLVPVGFIVPDAGLGAFSGAALVFLLKLVGFAVLAATIESFVVKMRFYRMQEYFALAFLTAFAGALLALASLAL